MGVRKIAARQNTAPDSITFPVDTLMKFVMTPTRCCVFDTSKSRGQLISWKEPYGPCEGRAEQHYYISVRTTCTTCEFGWCAVLWTLWKVVYGLRIQQSSLVDANGLRCFQFSG